jgi:hypothetical protein
MSLLVERVTKGRGRPNGAGAGREGDKREGEAPCLGGQDGVPFLI